MNLLVFVFISRTKYNSLPPPVLLLLFCLCITSNQAEFVSLFGDIYSCVFAALSARTVKTNLQPQQTKMLNYISDAAHHTLVLRWFRKHCFTSYLHLFFFTLPRFPEQPQITSFTTLDCCVLILQTDWLLKFRSRFILRCSVELISPLVLFVMLSAPYRTFQYKQETNQLL